MSKDIILRAGDDENSILRKDISDILEKFLSVTYQSDAVVLDNVSIKLSVDSRDRRLVRHSIEFQTFQNDSESA